MYLEPLRIVILGLSITSSWGNGHATTYRSLVRELSERGHDVLFLERDVPWYRENRDMPAPPWGRVRLYSSLEELKDVYSGEVAHADIVIAGSYVPEGVDAGFWINETAHGATAFYDIDTPVTLAKLERQDYDYLSPALVAMYDLYLSFTGGPILERIMRRYGSPMARPLYCSVDPELYRPLDVAGAWDLGYIGTYSADRQGALERLLFGTASRHKGRYVVAGPLYPEDIRWPKGVERIEHLPPSMHAAFYSSMRFTLNITRADMIRAGYSPSVRLFEAAACATPIISDHWVGIDEFFRPGGEILIPSGPEEIAGYLSMDREAAARIGERARARVLSAHTASHRVDELESYMAAVIKKEVFK